MNNDIRLSTKQATNEAPPAIEVPRLPRRPSVPTTLSAAKLVDGSTFQDITVANAELAEVVANDPSFERVLLKRADFARSKLTLGTWIDVRWDTSDFAEARWEKALFVRVELLGCRMLGTQLLEARMQHARFSRSNMTYARFWNAQFEHARFEQCELREASFEGANLSGVVFDRCDLREADLRGATLRGTDLRGSQLDGLRVGIKDLQGAIIDAQQAVQLAALLGVIVK
ncbi:MAG: hypothetical protein AVDCRST_MAG93-3392 [uncultured Chloroflexia bacterium]|uniref:Pentapeptide repeat family protein n=1 Tax=uncultured Chloroflexia bacterium TaxID=1672391 RepID=A0A6J4JPC2_9CHLR|nr:MAG: hypothetical protein AVDCRST_MAG93-3392 [uncultured Chloroflexia bacterium]